MTGPGCSGSCAHSRAVRLSLGERRHIGKRREAAAAGDARIRRVISVKEINDRNRRRIGIKLCGLRRPEDIRIVNKFMPEYAGFILAEGRSRSVTPEEMAALAAELHPGILRTAVFLDQDPEWIVSLSEQNLMDVIQLHGSESDNEIRMLRERTGKCVIKAYRIDSGADIERAAASPADMILLDHGAGGSGEAFDWSLIRNIGRSFILAGGLTPENVHEAVTRTRPEAVDVSSGVETDQVKDEDKVQRFVEAVRDIHPRPGSISGGR